MRFFFCKLILFLFCFYSPNIGCMESIVGQSVCFDNGIFGKNGFDVVKDFENWFLASYKQKTEIFIESFRGIIQKNGSEASFLDHIVAQNQTGFGGTTVFIDHQLQELKNACAQTQTSNILDVEYNPEATKAQYQERLCSIDNYFKEQLPVFQFAKLSENDLQNPELRSKKIVMQLLWEYTWLFKCLSGHNNCKAMANYNISPRLRSEMFFYAFDMEQSVDRVINFLNDNKDLICKAILKCKKSLFFLSIQYVCFEQLCSRNRRFCSINNDYLDRSNFVKHHSADALNSYYVLGKAHSNKSANMKIASFLKSCRPNGDICTAQNAAKYLYQLHIKETKKALATIKEREENQNCSTLYTFKPGSRFNTKLECFLEAYQDQEKSLTCFFRDALFLLYDPELLNYLFTNEFYKIKNDVSVAGNLRTYHIFNFDTLQCSDKHEDAQKINFIHKKFLNEAHFFLWIFYCKYCFCLTETRKVFLQSYNNNQNFALLSEIEKIHEIFSNYNDQLCLKNSFYFKYDKQKKSLLDKELRLKELLLEKNYEQMFCQLKNLVGEPFGDLIHNFSTLSEQFVLSADLWQSLLNVCVDIVKDPFVYLLFSKKIITAKDVQEAEVDGMERLWVNNKNKLVSFEADRLSEIDKKLRKLRNEINTLVDSHSKPTAEKLYLLIDAFESRVSKINYMFKWHRSQISCSNFLLIDNETTDYGDMVDSFSRVTKNFSWLGEGSVDLLSFFLWQAMKRSYNFKDFLRTGDLQLLANQIQHKLKDKHNHSTDRKDNNLSDLGLHAGGSKQLISFLQRFNWLFNKKYAWYCGSLFVLIILSNVMYFHYSVDNSSM